MREPVITTALLCQDFEEPDGEEGPITLKGVIPGEIAFLANYGLPSVRLFLYLHIDGDAPSYQFTYKWSTVREHPQGVIARSAPLEVGTPLGRAIVEVELPCPEDGYYYLEIALDETLRSRQQFPVRRPSA